MAGEIASLFVKLGLDAREFTAGVAQANKTTEGFGKGVLTAGNVAKGAFVAVGAGLAVVTKGAAEAERAQGEFMAATGKSRDEAKAFVSGMDSLAGTAGTVGLSFQQIAATGTMVEQQFGTTGQATTDLTNKVLSFAKVTHQDATQAAAGLEDTLSAYGLSAEDAAGFTDQLVASAQKYGTEVGPDQIAVLQKMAPALQAVGGNLEDGIGFLNLYEAAGGDAASATKGLTAAITKLPEGENLDEFVKRLSDMKAQGLDPTTEAIKVFGSKAGVGLAAAIQPGMDSMSDLSVSAQDAAGKVDTAASDMLTTSDKIKGMADKFVAGAREIGQKFGPAITGAASLASLSAPFLKGFAKMGAPAAKAFAKPFNKALGAALTVGTNLGAKIGAKIVGPITSAVSGAFASLAANSKITGAMDGLGKVMGGKLGTAIKGAAVLALAGLALDMAKEIGPIWDDIRKHQEGIAGATSEMAGKSTEEIEAAVARLRAVPDAMDPVQRAIFEASAALPFALGDAKNTWGRSLTELEDELRARGVDLATVGTEVGAAPGDAVVDAVDDSAPEVAASFDDLVTSFEDGSKALIDAGDTLAAYDPDLGTWLTGQDYEDAAPDVKEAVDAWVDTQNAAITQGAEDTAAALDKMKSDITDKLSAVQDAFNLGVDTKKKKNVSGAKRLEQMADDIDTITKRMNESIAANDPVNTAYWESALIDATNKYNTAKGSINVDANQIAADVAAATSSAGADMNQLGNAATNSATTINQAAQDVNMNPAVNTTATAADDMRESFRLANQAAALVPQGVQANVGATQTAASNMAGAVENNLTGLNTYLWGNHAGQDFVDGLDSNTSGTNSLSSVVNHWTSFLDRKLGFSSPPPEGPLHNLPTWGPHMVEAWIGPMLKHGMRKVPEAARKLAAWMAQAGKDEGIGDPAIAAPSYKRPDHHRRRHHNDAANPDVSPGDTSGDAITINVTVQGNIYGAGGTKQLAADLEKYVRRSKRGGARLVGAF